MGLSFEIELRKAEHILNNLIDRCEREGGGVYLDDGATGVSFKLTKLFSFTYYMPLTRPLRDEGE